MVARHLGDTLQHISALTRQVQSVAPPIARLVASFNPATLLQLVDQRDETARRDTELSPERLLADPFRAVHDSKNSSVGRNEVERAKSFRKCGGGVASNLRQQKRG
jgi:hypothetical protein